MKPIISIKVLGKNYKVALRNGNLFNYIFSRKYKTVYALKKINISIEEGELVGLIGPNGAGKSTLIKIMCGILVPSSGSINVLDCNPFKNRKNIMYNIGVVFGQRSQLWWDLPVKDSFYLLKKMYKVSDYNFQYQLKMFDDYLNVREYWNQPVRQLSLGQRMKAEIAVAILHNPKILFLDEPTIGLDVVAKRQVRKFIIEMNKQFGTTIILTTHDMKDIEEICDRIILVNHGKVLIDYSMNELSNHFNSHVTVNFEFRNPVDIKENTDLYEISSCSDDKQKWSLSINKKISSPSEVMFEIGKENQIENVKILEKTIEDIIHDIYKYGIAKEENKDAE